MPWLPRFVTDVCNGRGNGPLKGAVTDHYAVKDYKLVLIVTCDDSTTQDVRVAHNFFGN